MPPNRIEALVREMVDRIQEVVREEIRDTLGKRLTGPSTGASSSNDFLRPKGEKRTAEELDTLESSFIEFVTANPGLRVEQINKQLGTNTKELMLPIRKLLASNKIKTEGQKRSTKYFVGADGAKSRGKSGRSRSRD
jgi:hypothetical protein